ncbi:MAG: hypothetical protein AAF170_13560, partial [Bacteroidota bacterium]
MSDRSRQILLELQRRLAAARRRLTLGAVTGGALALLAVIGALIALALAAEAGWWMGSGLRTALAWLIGLATLALLVVGIIIPVLRAIGLLPG